MIARRRSNPVRRAAGILLVALTATVTLPGPTASAQNFFESLFGGFMRPHRSEPALSPQTSSYADPRSLFGHDRPRTSDFGGYGPSVAYCVRTCDGRFFPMQRHANASPAETCRSLCPASKTMVFSGSKIDHAVASNGTRYADLDNAFVYRERKVDNCSCNGKDAFGLARINVANDPTLRPGDIVATNEGLATYRGGRGPKSASAEFTPISQSASEWGRKLSEIKVTPQPEPQKIEPVAQETSKPRKGRRSAQFR